MEKTMNIQHADNGLKGKFYITQNDQELTEMTYVWVGTEKIIIDHTSVDDALRGQGAGRQLVAQAVEFTRLKHIKIIPLCPFC